MEKEIYERMFEIETDHWWFVSEREYVLDYLRRVGAGKDTLLLDLGCGPGIIHSRIAPLVTAFAVDYSEIALSLIRRRGEFRLARGNALGIPVRDEALDLVLCLEILYHRAITDDTRVMRGIARALKPGGRALFIEPAFEFLRRRHDEEEHTGRRYTRGELVRKIESSGFAIERSGYFHLSTLPLLLMRILFDRLGFSSSRGDLVPMPRTINLVLLLLTRLERLVSRVIPLPLGSTVIVEARRMDR